MAVDSTAGTSTIVLDTPVKFTHLGVVLSNFSADTYGNILDMRAEVRVRGSRSLR